MNLFKNIYIILLSIIMPFIVGAEGETWGMVSIGYGVLAGALLIYQKSKPGLSNPRKTNLLFSL
jgi:hypothetical protein